MKSGSFSFALAVSIALGIAQTFLLLYCWAYIAAYTPLPHWLMSAGVHGSFLRAVLFVLDFLTGVGLCIPAAFALCQLRPSKLPIYLLAAVIPGFLWQYRLFFQDPSAFHEFSQFIPGILSTLLVLPMAAAVLSRALKPAHA